jgi:hypothetical protein
MNTCAKFHRAAFISLGDILWSLNLKIGRETGPFSGRKFPRDVGESCNETLVHFILNRKIQVTFFVNKNLQ